MTELLAASLDRLGTETAFEVLARARALEAQGREIIHLEIGEPDFDTPPHIVEAGVAGAARRPHALLPGAGPAGAARGVRRAPVAPPRPRRSTRRACCVAPGAKPFLFFGVLATCDPGDEVDLPEPGLPDLRVGDPLGRRDAGAAAAERGDAASRSPPPTSRSG